MRQNSGTHHRICNMILEDKLHKWTRLTQKAISINPFANKIVRLPISPEALEKDPGVHCSQTVSEALDTPAGSNSA
jgi:hypothetical protein